MNCTLKYSNKYYFEVIKYKILWSNFVRNNHKKTYKAPNSIRMTQYDPLNEMKVRDESKFPWWSSPMSLTCVNQAPTLPLTSTYKSSPRLDGERERHRRRPWHWPWRLKECCLTRPWWRSPVAAAAVALYRRRHRCCFCCPRIVSLWRSLCLLPHMRPCNNGSNKNGMKIRRGKRC